MQQAFVWFSFCSPLAQFNSWFPPLLLSRILFWCYDCWVYYMKTRFIPRSFSLSLLPAGILIFPSLPSKTWDAELHPSPRTNVSSPLPFSLHLSLSLSLFKKCNGFVSLSPPPRFPFLFLHTWICKQERRERGSSPWSWFLKLLRSLSLPALFVPTHVAGWLGDLVLPACLSALEIINFFLFLFFHLCVAFFFTYLRTPTTLLVFLPRAEGKKIQLCYVVNAIRHFISFLLMLGRPLNF